MSKTQREYYLREQMKAIQRSSARATSAPRRSTTLRKKIEEAGLPEEAHEGGRPRAGPARQDAAGGGRVHGGAHVPRLAGRAALAAGDRRRDRPRPGPRRSWTRTTTASRRSRTGSSSTSRCGSSARRAKARSSASSARPASARRRSGRSIARALGRKFLRISLGGVRDEAEIRGHRRTYIGALPGRIIQGLRRAEPGTRSSCSTRSTSSARTSAATRPRRCSRCSTPSRTRRSATTTSTCAFDLSRVLFITTANALDTIPPPLRDRMEVIELAGYTEEEKLEIARRHLVPEADGGARARPETRHRLHRRGPAAR